MRETARETRREQIEKAAYDLLALHGYAGTSMLSIAKHAKASNETLYRWYGDKQGLFKAMVERNAKDVHAFLTRELSVDREPHATIRALGPKLLGLLVGPKAIALNRAAAADQSGELGAVIAEAGRNSVFPLIVDVFTTAKKSGLIQARVAAEEVAEIYMNLLVGDLQIRRAIGSVPRLSKADIELRSQRATTILYKAFATS